MKVLSIQQPWAWAILHAGKSVENRTWSTKYRGRLLIHAGTSRNWLKELGNRPLPGGKPIPKLRLLTFGAIVGYVDLIDCVPVEKVKSNPWAFGPWCWVLDDPVPLSEPFPCRGRLGLWSPPVDLVIDEQAR